jgi:hypothetical protein
MEFRKIDPWVGNTTGSLIQPVFVSTSAVLVAVPPENVLQIHLEFGKNLQIVLDLFSLLLIIFH